MNAIDNDSPETIDVTIYPELCCQRCLAVIHVHFDCPACGRDLAKTSMYHRPEQGEEFTCGACDELYRLESEVCNTTAQQVEVTNLMVDTECDCGSIIHHKPATIVFCDDCNTALTVPSDQ